MDTDNGKGTGGFVAQFAQGGGKDQHLIANGVIVKLATKVGAAIVFINAELATIANEVPIGEKWDWQEHIAMENKGTRRRV